MERLANEALSSNRRPPTVTINQGTIVNVCVAKDVDFTNVLHPAGNNERTWTPKCHPSPSSPAISRYQYEVLGIAST